MMISIKPTPLSWRSSTTTILLSIAASGSGAFASPSSSVSHVPAANSPTGGGVGNATAAALRTGTICIGRGIDATAIGILSSFVLSSAIGVMLWLIFAYLRPKFRQVYSVREWFVSSELRPRPLGKTFWAFLRPPVPLVPAIPKDVSSYSSGYNARADAALFPSDEELTQRILWYAFLLVLGWTILGVGGALPLYLVNTPCLAHSMPTPPFGGSYSILQDLSVLRLLAVVTDNRHGTTPSVSTKQPHRRVAIDDANVPHNVEIRLIVLTSATLGLVAAPALFTLLREYTKLVTHRRHWLDIRCGGLEMGWLGRAQAPGFDGMGENELKDFIVQIGLSSAGFKNGNGNGGSAPPRNGYAGVGAYRSRSARAEGDGEKAQPGIDLQGLFTIADTRRLASLIVDRDIILNHLEIAETRYISSFKLSTPIPSVTDFEIPGESEEADTAANDLKRRISRPRALRGSAKRARGHRHHQRTAPTSYVAPSSYYKLHDVRGIGDTSTDSRESLAQRIGQRIIGSRFQEIHNRDSAAFGRIPLGSHVQLDDRTGSFIPVKFSSEQLRHGPNDPSSGNQRETEVIMEEEATQERGVGGASTTAYTHTTGRPSTVRGEEGSAVTIEESVARPRPPKQQQPSQSAPPPRRSTFAMRSGPEDAVPPPPHLRLQPQQPFVRPVSGLDHDDLGLVYDNIREWRSRLKAINAEIADAQAEAYNCIADGARVKGWLLVGRGVRFLEGVQMIEGRSREDIKYHELQHKRRPDAIYWFYVGVLGVLLGVGLVAVTGLVTAPAPNVAHVLTFLRPLSSSNTIRVALATMLAPAVAAILFTAIALFIVHYTVNLCGAVSVSATRLNAFKATFLVLFVACCVWLTVCGSLLFSLETFSKKSGSFPPLNNRTKSLASGAVYIVAFFLVLVINVAVISPALLMIQPLHLWNVVRRERRSVTPRQRFRAIYPRVYEPSYAIACCLVGVTFAATFSLIFPLIGPAVCLLLFLTLIAHRFLIGYVYARTNAGYTGGVLQIWLVRCLADLVALQPILLGLIFLSRRLWLLGGVLAGGGVFVIILVEGFTRWKSRLPGISSLSLSVLESLAQFEKAAAKRELDSSKEEGAPDDDIPRRAGIGNGSGAPPLRSSLASVLDMMSFTLAVTPPGTKARGPIPLATEDLDDLTATEQAARTNPIAPPRLPPLPFTTHSEEMQGILYAPELVAPPPIIWLPDDHSGAAQSEAYDLQRYHDLKTTLDVSFNLVPSHPSNDSGHQRHDSQ